MNLGTGFAEYLRRLAGIARRMFVGARPYDVEFEEGLCQR
jgi:hypothetical protein